MHNPSEDSNEEKTDYSFSEHYAKKQDANKISAPEQIEHHEFNLFDPVNVDEGEVPPDFDNNEEEEDPDLCSSNNEDEDEEDDVYSSEDEDDDLF